MAKEPSFNWQKFSGLNKVLRPEELGPSDLSVARNVDIDRENRISRKKGYVSVMSGDYHSLWAAPDESICLAVKQGTLYRINDDWTTTALKADVGDAPMVYTYVNSTVYFTNNTVIGYVQDEAAHGFTDPAMSFKVATFPGHLISYFNGRLLIGKENILFFTDALAIGRIDMRKGFKQLPQKLTSILPVDGGVYVSDLADTYWLAGKGPSDMTIRSVESSTIPGSGVVIDGSLHRDGQQGKLALFTTTRGICMGTSDGQVVNLTQNKYRIPVAMRGATLVRNEADKRQYVAHLYN